MERNSLIVLIVDGLRASALGAYGNTWYRTAALDRLASESIVFDWCFAESTELQTNYHALWGPAAAADEHPGEALAQLLASRGYRNHLVTDEPLLKPLSAGAGFAECHMVEACATQPAEDSLDTHYARVLGQAADVVEEHPKDAPLLLWIHLRGLSGPWDAPPDLAARLLDEDDPDLIASIAVPSLTLRGDPDGSSQEAGEDADEILLASCRYAAQVQALDRCFAAFETALHALLKPLQGAFVLAGSRGFSLGEHGEIGQSESPYAEQFHVPLMVRTAAGAPALRRDSSLMQFVELPPLLYSLACGQPCRTASQGLLASATGRGDVYLRTPEWACVGGSQKQAGEVDPAELRLYVKPDDLWEANDVARRVPEQLELFQTLLAGHPHPVPERAELARRFAELTAAASAR